MWWSLSARGSVQKRKCERFETKCEGRENAKRSCWCVCVCVKSLSWYDWRRQGPWGIMMEFFEGDEFRLDRSVRNLERCYVVREHLSDWRIYRSAYRHVCVHLDVKTCDECCCLGEGVGNWGRKGENGMRFWSLTSTRRLKLEENEKRPTGHNCEWSSWGRSDIYRVSRSLAGLRRMKMVKERKLARRCEGMKNPAGSWWAEMGSRARHSDRARWCLWW